MNDIQAGQAMIEKGELQVLLSKLSENGGLFDIERRLNRLVIEFDGHPPETKGEGVGKEPESPGLLSDYNEKVDQRNWLLPAIFDHITRLEQIII